MATPRRQRPLVGGTRFGTTVDPELLTIGQAARFLKVRTSTVRRWLTQGLPTERLNRRRIRIRRSVLLAVLTRRLAPPISERPLLPPTWRILRGGRP